MVTTIRLKHYWLPLLLLLLLLLPLLLVSSQPLPPLWGRTLQTSGLHFLTTAVKLSPPSK